MAASLDGDKASPPSSENPEKTTDNVAQDDQPPQIEYPEGMKVVVIMASLLLAMFLVALDRTIIATAIPRITDDFNSLSDIGWYGSAYMLTNAGVQLICGRIYKFYSPKWVFLCSIIIFEIGSLLCGVAPSSIILIIGRAIAGLGASGILSGVIIIMTRTIPLHKRPIYSALFGATFGVSSVIGPLLGGTLTDDVCNVCHEAQVNRKLILSILGLLAVVFLYQPSYRCYHHPRDFINPSSSTRS